MLRSSASAGESAYELLKIPSQTDEPPDSYEAQSTSSRSSSQDRPLRSARGYQRGHRSQQSLTKSQSYHVSTRQFYLPMVLHRSTFLLLASLFFLLAASLALLFALSKRNTGIRALNSRLYYVWTYGPTAVFTAISILWYGIEFRTMQLWSWHLLYQNPVPARDMILDYTEMWDVLAMLVAIKKKHFRIVFVVLASLLLNALTVISTALFANRTAALEANNKFSLATTVQPPGNLNLAQIDALPYQQAFLVTHLNTTPPLGTNGDSVYEQFFDDSKTLNITASFATNTSYTAQVKTLTMRIECENGTVIDDPRANTTDGYTTTIHSATCTNTSIGLDPAANILQGGDYGLWAGIGCCGCGVNDGYMEEGGAYGQQEDNGQDWRLFISANKFKTHQITLNLANPNNSDFIALICTGKVDGRTGNVTLARDTGTHQIISSIVLGDNIDMGLNVTSGTQLLLGAYRSYNYFTGQGNTYNFLLNPGDDGSVSKFYDHDYLLTTTQNALPKQMAQIAASYFVSAANSTVTGYTSTISDRLVLRDVSFYLMMSVLLALVVVCAFMAFASPLQSCPRDPSSIAALAAILSQNPQLKSALRATGPYSVDDMKKYVGPIDIHSGVDASGSFNIVCNQRADLYADNKELMWWRPLTSAIPFRVLIIKAPLALIAILEVCVQISNRNGYLVTVSTSGGPHYIWLYAFPLLFLGVRSLFEMVNFSSKLFQRFHALALGQAPAHTAILESLNGKVAIVALVKSVRRGYWSVAASSFAMLFGPFLSILVASLFVGVPASTSRDVSVRQVDRWNFSDPTGSLYYSPLWYPGIDSRSSSGGITTYLGQDGVIPSMILNYNLSFPKWTTDQFVLPTFEVVNVTETSNNVTIQSRLPAMRSVLNCSEAHGLVSWWSRPAPNSKPGTIEVNVTYGVTGLGAQNDNCGYGDNITIGNSDIVYLNNGVASDFYMGDSVDTRLSNLNLTERTDCPTRIFFLAHLQDLSIKALACRPRIEQVEVDVTLNYPDLSFSAQYPPVIAPGVPIVVQDGFFNSSHGLPYTDADELNMSSVADPYHSSGMGDVFPSVNEVDNTLLGYGSNTFQQIVNSSGTSLEDMFNDVQLMDSQLERFYRVVVGQVLRSYGIENRAPSGNDPGQGNIKASLITYSQQVHLVDNTIVSRVLEGILALMTLCIIASMALQHTRRVVPKDPEGILAVMSLIAGASRKFWDIFDRIEGVEWMSDKEMAAKGVFDGVKFRMGWSGGLPLEGQRGPYSRVAGVDPDADDGERRWCIDIDEGPGDGIS